MIVSQPRDTVKELADRFDVTSPAISQRRSRMLAVIDDVRSGPLAECQLVVHIRRCVSGLVYRDDLPSWVGALFAARPDGPRNRGDLALLVVQVALDRPRLVSDSESGVWLVPRSSIVEGVTDQVKGIVHQFADEMTRAGSRLLTIDELTHLTSEWGVSPLSVSRFVAALMWPARRLITGGGRCVLLDHVDRQNVGLTIEAAMTLLDLPEQQVVDLFVTQHRRARGSILDELSTRTNR